MTNPLGGGNGMTPHYSGTTLDAQIRYAQGTKEILDNYFHDKPQNPANVIIGKSEWIFLLKACVWSLIGAALQRATRPRLTASAERR